MPAKSDPFKALQRLSDNAHYYSLAALEGRVERKLKRLPVSIRIMLESLLRNCDGKSVKEDDVLRLANWNAAAPQDWDVPFVVSRVILQDFTGVPLVVDLAAMRDAAAKQKFSAELIEPLVPVDLVIDHSVQVDQAGTAGAFAFNLELEFSRNSERYAFLKWGQQAFKTFKVVPPGIGIVHQVNLEHIASVVAEKEINGSRVLLPDTLVGTDSHTTMVNGLGVLGWGVGGIEAEAAMLGQPIFLQTPEVIGFHLSGALHKGVTATDLTLRITEMLRQEKVVGKFVEFFGEGASSLTVADRATISNMAPEYGATIGFFPVDQHTLDYLLLTGRTKGHVQEVKEYLTAQGLFGIPKKGEVDYTKVVELDISTVQPCVSGPKRPQDRINLSHLKEKFYGILRTPVDNGGYGKSTETAVPQVCVQSGGAFALDNSLDSGGLSTLGNNNLHSWSEEEMVTNRPFNAPAHNPAAPDPAACDILLTHGSVVIAAITSCTNTSNPSVMLAAGLLAKKAVERGLKVNPMVKTSLAPGSRVVTDYLEKTGLQTYLNQLGFELVAYGCTTCIGNSGPLEEKIEDAIKKYDLVAASVLSGNRNFEARIHSSVKANFLMSPPLVVAFAIAGRVNIDMTKEPLGNDKNGQPVYLKDIWPSPEEIQEAIATGLRPEMFKERYSAVTADSPLWKEIASMQGPLYEWDKNSTYIQLPPYFDDFSIDPPAMQTEFAGLTALALFGDSVTTDHISPAGSFRASSPAGQYLASLGVPENEFNSYGSRRGNHHVMMRGTFGNVRIRNKMAEGKEGGYTKLMPQGTIMPIFEACQIYAKRKTPLIIFAGKDYGMGSSRDWAAKGTVLLGVKVVVASSFERIHRSNLIGMGVLPLQFKEEDNLDSLGITGDETFTVKGIGENFKPQQEVILEIDRDGSKEEVKLISRLDTPSEIDYYLHGGIMPFVLRQLIKAKA